MMKKRNRYPLSVRCRDDGRDILLEAAEICSEVMDMSEYTSMIHKADRKIHRLENYRRAFNEYADGVQELENRMSSRFQALKNEYEEMKDGKWELLTVELDTTDIIKTKIPDVIQKIVEKIFEMSNSFPQNEDGSYNFEVPRFQEICDALTYESAVKYADAILKKSEYTENEIVILNKAYEFVVKNGDKQIQYNIEKIVGSNINGLSVVTPVSDGKKMLIPQSGDVIFVNRGIELPDIQAIVSSYNAWSLEYSVEGCNSKYPNSYKNNKCTRRLNYAVDTYKCNKDADDLLQFYFEGYNPCFAGAMVDGFGEIGDIVEVTLDDGTVFNFLILDTKSTTHSIKELSPNNQCQNEWGHGYMISESKVQLSICEFITASDYTIKSATEAPSGEFLKKRSVVEVKIIGKVHIDSDYIRK